MRLRGEERSGVEITESAILLLFLLDLSVPELRSSSRDCVVLLVVLVPSLRFKAEAVRFLSAFLEAPILPPLSREDLGVKKRVKDLGVIVGGLRGLPPVSFCNWGRIGDELGSCSHTAVIRRLDVGLS